jgi:hypothetical protein
MTLDDVRETVDRIDLLCAALTADPENAATHALLQTELEPLSDRHFSEQVDDCPADLAAALEVVSARSEPLRLRVELADAQDDIDGITVWSLMKATSDMRMALHEVRLVLGS